MPNVDFTLNDVRAAVHDEIVAERSYTDKRFASFKTDIEIRFDNVKAEIVRVRTMLEEDILAESRRLTRVEKRVNKTTKLLMDHISST